MVWERSEMSKSTEFIQESDYFRVAALDFSNLTPTNLQFRHGRVYFYFPKTKAQPILNDFDSGLLVGSLRDYAASLVRTKNRIFSIERDKRATDGTSIETRRDK